MSCGNQKQVQIPRDFYIGIFPVTQGQWRAIMGVNPSWFSRGGAAGLKDGLGPSLLLPWPAGYFSHSGAGADKVKGISVGDLNQFPVESVSWLDVQEFLKRLNTLEKASGLLFRLPAEAEWEYSCRGGASSPADCAFDFSFTQPTNDLSCEQANFNGNYPAGSASKGTYLEHPTKVGSYQPNRLGIYDMHGNVWEWCQDCVGSRGSARIIRGGSWFNYGFFCRSCEPSQP